jgi:STE24 endopeptidase
VSVPLAVDPERQARAREYARTRRKLFFADIGLSGVLAVAWLTLGWAVGLERQLLAMTQNIWLVVAGFAAVFGMTFQLAGLPLAYYSGYVLPHRYGLSTQSFAGWVRDQLLATALLAALGLPLISGLYWLLRAAGDAWWLWAGVAYVLVAVVLSNLAPVVIMPLFNKYVPLGSEHAELVRRLINLASRAGTRVSGVFRFDMSRRTKAANAALTGIGNTRRIILGDTLLNEFTTDEVETVIAHELGHHVHRDIPIGIVVSGLITLAGLFLASIVLRAGAAALGLGTPASPAAMPLLMLVLGAFALVTLPLNNAYSRWREVLADEYALKATNKPLAFANAMARLANQNLAEADPEPWVVFFLHSHPPIRARLAMAEAWQARVAPTS